MVAVAVTVRSRWSTVGDVMGRSPRFSAFAIGLSSYGLWGHCGTVNVGSYAPACPLLLLPYARGAPLSYKVSAPPIRTRIRLVSQSGDHILNILPLDLHISSLLDNPLIHKLVHKTHCIMTVSYVLSNIMTTIHLSVSKWILV
jgi:hypothetical protein